jgi:hypothetical protein
MMIARPAGTVVSQQAGHRALRGRLIPLGQRAQEEREVTSRVLDWLRQKCVGEKSVVLRDLLRSLVVARRTWCLFQ